MSKMEEIRAALVAGLVIEDGKLVVPKLKISENKETYPGAKQIFRQTDKHGKFAKDILTTAKDAQDGTALVEQVMAKGKLCKESVPIEEIQKRAQDQIAKLDDKYKQLEPKAIYPVEVSKHLEELTRKTREGLGT